MSQDKRNNGWGGPLIIAIVISLVGVMLISLLSITHTIHSWHTETFDDVTVKVCSKCGEIKEVHPPKCRHNWSVRQEGDEFIAFCTNCDETKVAD